MLDMLRTSVLPQCLAAQVIAADAVLKTRAVLGEKGAAAEEAYFNTLRGHVVALQQGVAELEAAIAKTHKTYGALEEAKAARDCILTAMNMCREHADALESMVDDTLWVLPKYAELLWVH